MQVYHECFSHLSPQQRHFELTVWTGGRGGERKRLCRYNWVRIGAEKARTQGVHVGCRRKDGVCSSHEYSLGAYLCQARFQVLGVLALMRFLGQTPEPSLSFCFTIWKVKMVQILTLQGCLRVEEVQTPNTLSTVLVLTTVAVTEDTERVVKGLKGSSLCPENSSLWGRQTSQS